MPDEIVLTSTTDTPEQVHAALGLKAPVTPPVVETPKADEPAKDAATTEAVAAETKPAGDTPAPVSEAGKALSERKRGLQARIDELTREKYTSQRERDEAKAHVTKLEKELTDLKAKGTPAPDTAKAVGETATPAAETTGRPVKPKAPKEEDFPVYADYEKAQVEYDTAADKYIEDLADWKAEQKSTTLRAEFKAAEEAKVKAQREAEIERDAKATQQKFLERQQKTKAKHPDFDTAIDSVKDVMLPLYVLQHIAQSEVGAELQYYLATHPTELVELADLKDQTAGTKKLLTLELKAEGGTLFTAQGQDDDDDVAPTQTAKVPVSGAPAPGARVHAGGTTAPVKDPEKMSQQEYNAWRAQQIAAKNRARLH